MRLLKFTPKIDFIGKRRFFYGLSIAMVLASVAIFVVNRGPIFNIEFTGGTLVQVKFSELPKLEEIRDALNDAGWSGYSLQTQPASHTAIVKVKEGEKSKEDISGKIVSDLKQRFGETVADHPERVEFVGPVIGRKFMIDTLFSVVGSLIGIIIYVAWRFKNWKWGLAGVIAITHDVFISWGLLTGLGRETSLVVVAALLTLAGYSINDTIVIFDRVRENVRSARRENFKDLLNRSINETLGRTVNTALIVFFAVLALLIWGGDVLRDFTIVLMAGVILGAYSTLAVAIGLVYTFEQREKGKA